MVTTDLESDVKEKSMTWRDLLSCKFTDIFLIHKIREDINLNKESAADHCKEEREG